MSAIGIRTFHHTNANNRTQTHGNVANIESLFACVRVSLNVRVVCNHLRHDIISAQLGVCMCVLRSWSAVVCACVCMTLPMPHKLCLEDYYNAG